MRHHTFGVSNSYNVALLMKASAFDKQSLLNNYVNPLDQCGVPASSVVAYTLQYDGKKLTTAYAKEYLKDLMPELKATGIKYIICTDSNYFKLLVGEKKADIHQGYVLPCAIAGYEHMFVILSINYQQLVYDPTLRSKVETSIQALASHIQGNYQAPGTGIIHKTIYPQGVEAIKQVLQGLHEYPELTCDIEAFSLRFWEAGIGTISFAIDEHNGVAFACDYKPNEIQPPLVEKRAEYGRYEPNYEVRAMLKEFFITYKGKITYHNAGYDVKVILYVLWMRSLLDQQGLLEGLEVLTRSIDDTKIIAYLATNSTAGNVLGLKPLAQEFAGNWAVEDIKDIKLIPLADLLQYNLVDSLSTWYVKKKYYPIMVQDQQLELYTNLLMPSQKLILQMELTGMPMDKAKIYDIEAKLSKISADNLVIVRKNPWITKFEDEYTKLKWEKDYQDRKKKAKNPDKILYKDFTTYPRHEFNPGSPVQLQTLLFEMMQLPVLERTDTKQPATGEDVLEKLVNHVSKPEDKEMLEALVAMSQVSTILSTFIPAFKRAISKAEDGIVWLHGSFNIGGTVSGRLSSSDPNLQNIPSNSIFGKLIKEAFTAPKGWVFCGADFNSLEDYISALTTKDPNKLKVYTDGFDGHCLRAAYYFRDELIQLGLNIDVTDPNSVNSIKKKAPEWRQESKVPTFALTYQGTFITLMRNLGWPEEKAKRIEGSYHQMYAVSDDYIQSRLEQASHDGYVTVAFGLRLRTPLIGQVMWGSKSMPYEAAAEGRTAGNAMGQSYGLLNNRAAVDFWKKVWASKYKYDILPCALIHDAIYCLVKEDPEVVEWANRELIKSMQWQELPEIQHPTVKLGAALDLFWPNWANAITLPNDADQATIIKMCQEAKVEYQTKKGK